MDKIKLQVVCLTYNHEKYIRQALDGFVMQKTNFPFEVLIGDDASTDGTADIIREYAKKYPQIIKPVLRKKNVGAQHNSVDMLKRVNAKYLVLCEGDDYWTDALKLQTQVDFLDAHPDCNGCWHNAEIKKEPDVKKWNTDFFFPADKNGRQFWPNSIQTFDKNKGQYKIPDILDGPIATASIVYRYKKMKYPQWFANAMAGDRAMHCFMLRDKYFAYIDKTMSVYRVSKTGAWFNKNNNKNVCKEMAEWFAFINNINKTLGSKYNDVFKEYLTRWFISKMNTAANDNDTDVFKFVIEKDPDVFANYIKWFVCQARTRVYARRIFKIPFIKVRGMSDCCLVYLLGVRLLKLKRLKYEK